MARIEKCLKVVEKTKAKLMIGFNRRFDPNFANLEQRIRKGDIGAVELVTVISRDPGPPPVDYIKRSGGLYRDMMIHDFDMARFLVGEEFVVGRRSALHSSTRKSARRAMWIRRRFKCKRQAARSA